MTEVVDEDVNVLFIEDDPAVAEMYKLKLERSDGVTKNIPVIILSNYGEKELVDRGLKLGALDYLIKSETTPASLSRGVQDWVKE